MIYMKANTLIKIRPHHVLCNYCFVGSGYSNEFVDNFAQINNDIVNNGSEFQIMGQLDSICMACPNQNGNKCNEQDKVTRLDNHHMQALGVQDGDVLDWDTSVQKIKAKITPEVFAHICHECEWYSLNICYNKLFK